jgi:hypothetical protein
MKLNPKMKSKFMKRIPLFLAVLSLSLAFQARAAVILIDFNNLGTIGAPDTNGNFWNITNTGVTVNLNDTTNTSTGIVMTGTVGAAGGNTGGTTTPDASLGSLGIVGATQDNIVFTAAQAATSNLTLSGLDANTLYSFSFFGSRSSGTNLFTTYTVTGANSGSGTLQVGGTGIAPGQPVSTANNSTLVDIFNITADGSNQIILSFSTTSPNGYINALRITTTPVPEPSTVGMLMGGGFLMLGVMRFRRGFLG